MLRSIRRVFTKIISNLFTNAIKYSDTYIHVKLRLDNASNLLTLSVENDGVIVPKAEREEIFKPFKQYHEENTHVQGTGIGLALARSLAELHGGKLSMDEALDCNRFILQLPLCHEQILNLSHTEEEEAVPAVGSNVVEPLSQSDSFRYTLLIVEDNAEMRKFLQKQLAESYKVFVASNGVEALKILQTSIVNLVLSDIMMPEMDGLEMLQSIRKDFQISHIPVIILTAKNDEGAKTKSDHFRGERYITKPFSKEYLLARIDQLLAERKLFRERIRQQMENQTTTEEDSYEQFLVKKDVQFLEKIHQVIEENMDDSDLTLTP